MKIFIALIKGWIIGLAYMGFYISAAKYLDYKTLHKLFCGLSSTARIQALHVKKQFDYPDK